MPDRPESHGSTANDRFKARGKSWFWISLTIAVLAHAAVFAFAPGLSVAEAPEPTEPPVVVNLPPDAPLPPPPEPILQPARPIPSADAPDLSSMPPTTLDANPLDALPPLAAPAEKFEDWVPSMLKPRLVNEREVSQALVRRYPPVLRAAGVTGEVLLEFLIDEEGRVVRTRVARSSGYPDLDAAAMSVAGEMRFTPAMNRDQPVAVRIAIPVRFSLR